ncbi:MAG: GatB/YqeY domain-containing protein [Candidatus Methylacidiphilales bacterium]|nr:GatB/YqeY domain-containing protein [Candidatus Methylacidiphilales bacterium]
MPALFLQIDEMIKDAMRAKDADKLGTLRLLKSAVKYAAIEKHGADGQPSDDEVIAVIRKEAKKRQDSIDSFTAAGRADAAAKEKSEKDFLETLLPAALGEAELEALVKAAISETGATTKAQMGLVMKAASAKAAGRADGKTLSGIVQRLLA